MNLCSLGWVCSCAFLLAFGNGFARPMEVLAISSPAFSAGGAIPAQNSLAGGNISPELLISAVPANAKSLVLIVDDPDAPSGVWTHWLVWNLPVETKAIAAGKVPAGARQGKNSFGRVRYDGPSPPSGTHRYFFRLYALDDLLALPAGSDRDAVVTALFSGDHVVAEGEVFGTYQAAR